MTEPARPVPAATVVLLRDRVGAAVVETLLIQRHARSKFAAGDHVFAGGKVEPDELPPDAERHCAGLTASAAAVRLGGGLDPLEALAYWVGAAREAFEEVGVLLAYGADGGWLGPERQARLATHRAACHRDHRAFFEMLRAERLTLATDRMAYFAHWITPEESALRFDTRFFAATMPPDQVAVIDGHEIVGCCWLTPAEAVAAAARKEIALRFPTLKNLELVGAGASAAAAVAALATRDVPTIRPRILTIDGRPQPIIPPDPRWY